MDRTEKQASGKKAPSIRKGDKVMVAGGTSVGEVMGFSDPGGGGFALVKWPGLNQLYRHNTRYLRRV